MRRSRHPPTLVQRRPSAPQWLLVAPSHTIVFLGGLWGGNTAELRRTTSTVPHRQGGAGHLPHLEGCGKLCGGELTVSPLSRPCARYALALLASRLSSPLPSSTQSRPIFVLVQLLTAARDLHTTRVISCGSTHLSLSSVCGSQLCTRSAGSLRPQSPWRHSVADLRASTSSSATRAAA